MSQSYRYSWMTTLRQGEKEANANNSSSTTWKSRIGGICSSFLPQTRTRNQVEQQISSPLAARLSRPSQASIRRMKETSNRALAYIVGFLLTYIFSIIRRYITLKTGNASPFVIVILARFFYPLQG